MKLKLPLHASNLKNTTSFCTSDLRAVVTHVSTTQAGTNPEVIETTETIDLAAPVDASFSNSQGDLGTGTGKFPLKGPQLLSGPVLANERTRDLEEGNVTRTNTLDQSTSMGESGDLDLTIKVIIVEVQPSHEQIQENQLDKIGKIIGLFVAGVGLIGTVITIFQFFHIQNS